MPSKTIACKLPMGLVLKVYELRETQEPAPGDTYRSIKKAFQVGKSVRINGWNEENRKIYRNLPPPASAGAFALTHNVDAAFWDAWYQQNKETDIVQNGLIFASDKPDEINRQINKSEKDKLMCGLEPVNPLKPPVTGIKQNDSATVF